MRRHLAKIALLFASAVLPAVCTAKGQKSVVSCARAAFSRQGDLVAVTANGQTLDLEIIRANGARESGRATIRTNQYGDADCSVFVSDDGSLAAVATRVPLEDSESVRVWDLAAAKWRSSFELAPRKGLEGRITALGFWRGGPHLLVQGATRSVLALALVGTRGEAVAGPAPASSAWVDPDRGRVWTASGGWSGGCGSTITGTSEKCYCAGKDVPCSKLKTPCLYSETTFRGMLLRPPVPGPARVPCDYLGGATQLVGFPSADMIAGAKGLESYRDAHEAEFAPGGPYGTKRLRTSDGTVVSVFNVATNRHEQFVIPAPRKQLLDAYVEAGPAEIEVSPHGNFFGVLVQVTRWSHFDTQRAEWNELHVFQTAPFREIGKIGPKKGCGSPGGFAVGDADGKAHVALNWCGKWTVEEVSGPKPVLRH